MFCILFIRILYEDDAHDSNPKDEEEMKDNQEEDIAPVEQSAEEDENSHCCAEPEPIPFKEEETVPQERTPQDIETDPEGQNTAVNQPSHFAASHGVSDDLGKDSILGDSNNMSNQSASETVNENLQQGSNQSGGDGRPDNNSVYDDGFNDSTNNPNKDSSNYHMNRHNPPNPWVQKGDVQKEWFRRLNIIDSSSEVENLLEDKNYEDFDAGESKGKDFFEYTNTANADQVLGESTADDAVHIPDKSEKFTDENKISNSLDKSDIEKKRKTRDRSDSELNNFDEKRQKLSDDDIKDMENIDEIENSCSSDSDLYSEHEKSLLDVLNEDELQEHQNEELLKHENIYTNHQFQFGQEHTTDMQIDSASNAHEFIELSDNIYDHQLSTATWLQHLSMTEPHAIRLCEQLRLILEPTLMTRLQGDYRTGKKINMKKIIPYIASGFRKDKIWLRRTKPGKRNYQVMVLIDDSKSMGLAGNLAVSSLALLSNAFHRLDIGDLCVASFSENLKVLHPFGQPFNQNAGIQIVSSLQFQAENTILSESLKSTIPIFSTARGSTATSSSSSLTLQLCFIISDARIDSENRDKLDSVIRKMAEENILVVLVVIDCNEHSRDSIFNTKTVSFLDGKVITKSYFDNFPFPYYVTIQNVNNLPSVLADALKQWFELIRLQLGNR